MPYYNVKLSAYDDEDNTTLHLGEINVEAKDKEEAHFKAKDELWDYRLDIVCNIARSEIEEIPQYLVNEGWDHIFEWHNSPLIVRFVFDRIKNKIVEMDILRATGWKKADITDCLDVQDSLLNANDEALENPEGWGFEATNEMPEWVNQK